MVTRKPRVMIIPYPAQGHVKPLMVFSHKLAKHGFRITFVNTEFNHKRILSAMADDDKSCSGFGSEIDFVSISDGLSPENNRTDLGQLCRSVLDNMPGELEKLIVTLNGTSTGHASESSNDKISCVVLDVHTGWAIEVAAKMGVKGAVFCPSSAALSVYTVNIPKMIHDGIIDSYGIPTKKQLIQLSTGMPVMDTKKLPWRGNVDSTTQNTGFNHFVKTCKASITADWWLCNTTYEIESAALSSLPKILPIGPLMANQSNSRVDISSSQFWVEDSSCLTWLDQHKPRSVIYVAFGSCAIHEQTQIRELAFGLELIGMPFLWVIRPGFISKEQNNEFNIDGLFANINSNLRKIVSWAPQQKVLGHPSIACFVTHCGWNSTIEGLSNGLPFLCWPYFGDQFLNMSYICDVWKVGMGFEPNENGIIRSDEVKNKVNKLLDDEDIRRRSLELKEIALRSIAKDGQSSKNFNNFIKWLEEA